MAVKRTGTPQKNSETGFLLEKFLQALGRPFFWLFLAIGYFFIFLASLILKLCSWLKKIPALIGKTVLWLPKKIFFLTFSKIKPLFFFQFLPAIKTNLQRFLTLIASTFRRQKRLILRLRQRRKTFGFGKIKIKTSANFIFLTLKIHLKRLKFLITKPSFLKLPRLKLISLKLPKVSFPRLKIKWFLFLPLTTLIIFTGFLIYWYVLKDLPYPDKLVTKKPILTTKIYDRNHKLLYKIYRNQNRSLVKLEEIPLHLVQATLAIEDAEFYQHSGLSFKGISRAFLKNFKGNQLYGGSTITQQLVKNALLSPERTLQRKLKEAALALWVEKKFTKDEILQMYFNEVSYGGATYGVEEAAQIYFGKSVRQLNLAEAALLAGLPASPTIYSPFGAYPEKAKERQLLVLKRMREEKFITPKQELEAAQKELFFAPQRTDIKAPHFVMYIKDLLVKKYGSRLVEEGGLEVITSLDLETQEMAQKIASQEIERLKNLNVGNGAVLITQPQSGEILAMVGSKNYFDLANDGNVNVTLRPRQPGSSIKPVMYSLALEKGFTAATIITDTPITYHLPGQPPYSPRNYDGRFHGPVSLRTALASSYNVPAVKVLSALGVNQMIKRGQAMGITTWNDSTRFGLSLTLGGGEVKMVDMAVAYGVLANLGTRVDLKPILTVKNYQGEIIEKPKTKRQKVFDPRIAFILTDILSDNTARTPAFGLNSVLNIPDHPHIGYTPDYLTAVWVGNNDNKPMNRVASGITGASPIWQKIMIKLLKERADKEFIPPKGLVHLEICPTTGTLPCQNCRGKWEYFLSETQPKIHCRDQKEKIKSPKN